MATTICPACKLPLEVHPTLAGQSVACPRCRTTFTSPTPPLAPMPSGPAPTAPPAPMRPAAELIATTEPAGAGARYRDKPVTLLDLFDLNFSRYVTPLIVKITWVLTLIFTSIWLLVIVSVLLIDMMPDVPETARTRPTMQMELADTIDFAWWRGLIRLIVLATQVTGAVLFLLWMRVLLESVIVVFNIAASLRSIDRKTKPSQ